MNDDEVLTAITRMEANLKALLDKIDMMQGDILDHETRLRDLEAYKNTMLGKLTALFVIATTVIGVVIALVAPWQ